MVLLITFYVHSCTDPWRQLSWILHQRRRRLCAQTDSSPPAPAPPQTLPALEWLPAAHKRNMQDSRLVVEDKTFFT